MVLLKSFDISISNKFKQMTKPQAQPINQLDKEIPKWFAVYVHFKREKLVKKMLDQKGIESYLPLRKEVRNWSKKQRTMELPLISCYIFVKITTTEYVPVLETEHVLNFVKFAKDLIAIPDHEIELIKNILQNNIDFEIARSEPLEKGDNIIITAGSLAGTRGQLIEIEGKKRVVVTLDFIQHSFRLSVEKHLIQKV
jgi:transcription antitermination factor NusG